MYQNYTHIDSRCCNLPFFIMLAGSTFLAYSWAPWWLQFYEYAGQFAAPDVLVTFVMLFLTTFFYLVMSFTYNKETKWMILVRIA